ncbi:MAG: site-specific integrase [Clostridia bacterium]|nr:site-specific integrase [Clostridia bacterium]
MKKTPKKLQNISLGEWLFLWYDTYKKPYLKPYSLRNIEQMIRLHTPEWLKAMPMPEITQFDIDRALSQIPCGRTYTYARQVLHSAFLKAEKLDIIERNVIILTDQVRYRKKRGKALTSIEQKEFINALEGKRVKWLMLFYLYTGVRRTEALDLEWNDINEAEKLILIKGTKTADSYREILLTDDIKAILDGQRKQIERDKGTRYETKHPEKVFDYQPSYISQAFKKICPSHHLHDLRHTYITRCAECGMNINVCQQLVGHSTPQMTMQIYTHVFDDFKRKEALKFTINPTYN